MRTLLTGIFILISTVAYTHPLHMSVSNVSINGSEIQIETKVFAKDLAHELNALNHLDYDANYYLVNKTSDSLLIKHFKKNFKVEYNNQTIEFENLTLEIIDDSFIIKASASIENECQSCKIRNSLLLQTNHDQKNLVIVNYNGIEKGIELTLDKPEETLMF